MPDKLDFYNQVARKKLGVGHEWRWRTAEQTAVDEFMIEGGVPRTHKSGPEKGQPSWAGVRMLKCRVRKRDLVAVQAAYEGGTGLCYICQGDKQECARCEGTGMAPNRLQPATG